MGFDDARVVLVPRGSLPTSTDAPSGTSITGKPVRLITFRDGRDGAEGRCWSSEDLTAWLRAAGFSEAYRVNPTTL